MAFLIDEAYLPATLTAPPMTDQQFAEFCAEHPDLFFEMTEEGELIVMLPNFNLTGTRNSEIAPHPGALAIRPFCSQPAQRVFARDVRKLV